jgi:hypothetical protein
MEGINAEAAEDRVKPPDRREAARLRGLDAGRASARMSSSGEYRASYLLIDLGSCLVFEQIA